MGMAVGAGWGAVGGPAGVSNAAVRVEDLGQIELVLVNKLLQLSDLANLLEGKHLLLLVSIDCETRRVVPAVLETGETCICRKHNR